MKPFRPLFLILLTAAPTLLRAQSPFAIHYHLDSQYSISSLGMHAVQIGSAHYIAYNVQRQPSLDTTTSILAKVDGTGKVVFSKRVQHDFANTFNLIRTSDNHLLMYHARRAAGATSTTPYITKMDTALNVVWSISGISAGLGLAERSTDYVVYGGTNTGTVAGGSLRVVRLAKSTGAVLGQASTTLSGAGGAPDMAHPMASGNYILAGQANGTGSGNSHSFIASIGANGAAAWVRSLENVIGKHFEFTVGAEDGAGNVYAAGYYQEGTGATTTSAALVKLSPTGAVVFARRYTLPPAAGTQHSSDFFSMTVAGGELKVYGRASSFDGTLGFHRLVQLRMDTSGSVLGQKVVAVHRAPFSTQNLPGGPQSPWTETPDGRLFFAVTSFRECVSNRHNILLVQTAPGTTATGCDSTGDAALLVDSAIAGLTPTTIFLSSSTSTQTAGAGLTTLGYADRALTRTRYCDCARMDSTGTTSVVQTPASSANDFMLVPNPANSAFRITGLDAGYAAAVEILDAVGRAVWSDARCAGGDIPLSAALPDGVYTVRVRTASGTSRTLRLLVRR